MLTKEALYLYMQEQWRDGKGQDPVILYLEGEYWEADIGADYVIFAACDRPPSAAHKPQHDALVAALKDRILADP